MVNVTWQVIQGDCLDVLRGMESGSVDAVITDPPFFCPATHYQSRVKYQRRWADMSILTHWWTTISVELRRVCKEEGHTLVFSNADSYPAFYPAMYGQWDKLVCLVWDKQRPGLGRVWRHQHELIIAARNQGAFEPTDHILRPDVLHCKATLSRDREHPVEKPPELLAELIAATCPSGATILDPFLGSGTTGVAAVRLGHSFIGIEREAEYCDIARKRISEAAAARQELLPLE